jgi:hypothetical protein
MYCPHCGRDLWFGEDGEAHCPTGAVLSLSMTRTLAELPSESVRLEDAPRAHSRWFCPTCGASLVDASDGCTCTSCGLRLHQRLLRQLVELNPHEAYPPKPPAASGLVAYWITRPGESFSIGVTAWSVNDAVEITRRAGYDLPEPIRVVENVRPQDLDPRHVLPNAGPLIVRGVWYPLTSLGAGA